MIVQKYGEAPAVSSGSGAPHQIGVSEFAQHQDLRVLRRASPFR